VGYSPVVDEIGGFFARSKILQEIFPAADQQGSIPAPPEFGFILLKG
jgi:hypothetical protein